MYIEYVCGSCKAALEEHASMGPPDVEDCAGGGPECALCGRRDETCDYVEIESVTLDDSIWNSLTEQIHGCEAQDCARKWDAEDQEDLWNDTNAYLHDLMTDLVEDLARDTAYHALLHEIMYFGKYDDVFETPDLTCPKCGNSIDGWHAEVMIRARVPIIDIPHSIPNEIDKLIHGNPYSRIEYHRSDCSLYLTHLTRGGSKTTHFDNVTEEPLSSDLTAPQVLWIILSRRVLEAFKGTGMRRPAVCFTEKPLTALKDSLVGLEAQQRQSGSLRWAPYGLMFEKEYLKSMGAKPVIPCERGEEDALPDDWRYRVVTHASNANFLHEREWRVPTDVKFDIGQCVVLVPTFEQVVLFSGLLAKEKLQPKGFLALLDVFAAV